MSLERFCEKNPKVCYIPEYDPKESTDWFGVRALWYEGAEYQGKKTKVFAYLGYPKMQQGEKVPAVVLVHGGGGHPYAEWIRKWNDRGFAAIAMDTTGNFPCDEWKGLVGTEDKSEQTKYKRELHGELLEEGYTVGPDNSEMKDCDLPLEEQWMYHAVSDTILAHNILRNDPLIDSDKIGIVGISWGGTVTSIAIGYDTRYAFAIPIYGSGYLDYLPAPEIPRIFGETVVKRYWNAADRFKDISFPILWLCYCEDHCFSFGANSLSYLATKESNSCLSIKRGMGHSHSRAWNALESYRFAEKILQEEVPLVRCITEPKRFEEVSFEIEIPDDFTTVSADIYYLTEPFVYNERYKDNNDWKCVEAEILEGKVFGKVPKNTCGYFVEFKGETHGEAFVSTSAWVEREVKL